MDLLLIAAAPCSRRRFYLCFTPLLILRYLDKGPIAVSDTLMREALHRLVPEQTERIMGCMTQPYFDKGKAEGKADILVRLTERRFGDVPSHLRQRIFAADVATIEQWVDRILDAPDLQSVFEQK